MPIISNFPGGSGSGQLKISSISVTTPPAKTTYKSGESFDPTGMVVTADYGYGITAPVTGYEVTPSVLTDGVTSVTVSYTENRVTKTATQPVTVTPVLASIAVTKNPTKTVYSYLESFDPAGMTVTATMTDGSTKSVTGYTYPETAFSTLGSQSVPITYTEDGVTKSTSLTVTVNAIELSEPTQSNAPRYTGSTLTPEWSGYDTTKMSISGDTSGIDARTYTAAFTTIYGYTFPAGTTANVDWTIGRQILPGIPAQSNVLIADGTEKTPTFSNYDPDKMDISGDTSGTAAGEYDAIFTPKSNYEWPDGTHGTKTVTWVITDVQVPIPSQINIPTYDGNPKTPEWTNADLEHSTVSVSSQVNAGDYTATWSLTGGVWADGTTEDKTIPWSISKADPVVTAPTAKSLTYTGEAQELVTSGITTGGTLQYSTDNASWSTNIPTGINTGDYTVYYRVVGNNNYNDGTGGSVDVSIGKAPGSVSTSPTSVTLNTDSTSAEVTVNRAGDGEITASSSDESICTASVNGNVVTVSAPTMATKTAGDFAVGDTVYLNEDGSPVEYLVVHQGLPSSMYDASCNGTWLLRKDIAENRQWHSSNVNNLENSTIHSYLNSTFLNLIDANIRSQIKTVKIPYRSGGGSGGTTKQGANGLSCQIFLLSGAEVCFTHTYMDSGEGAVLSYFSGCATTSADSKRIANLNGSAAIWWLRSPNTNSTNNVWGVDSNGYYGNFDATYSCGVRPALIIDSTATLSGPADPQSGNATIAINVAEGSNHTAASASVGVTAQFLPYHAEGLEAYTPEEIKQICDAGKASEYWNVGDMHSITLNGTVGTLALSNFATYVYIQEFTEDGHIRWGCFKDSTGKLIGLVDSKYNSYATNGTKYFNMNHWGNYNHGGWKGCDLRYDILGSTKTPPSGYGSAAASGRVGYDAPADTATSPVANTLMAAFPAEWREIMRPITWYTDNVGGGNDVASQVTAVVDYLPLMAEFQIHGARSYANSAEQNYQHQLAYFAAGNTKVHYQHSNTGTAASGWCAGPRCSTATTFCLLSADGSANDNRARGGYALAPGFET